MKKRFCFTAVLVAAFVVHAIALFGQQDSVASEITALEQKFNAAYAVNDLKTYFSYYAPDMVQWLPEGRTDLAAYEKDWTAYIAAGNKTEAADVSDLVVKVGPSRDSAVAAYVLHVKTKLANGQVTNEEFQETDFWFKRDGVWKIVALHYSPAAKKK
jgi:ketosteroid isomerase-like protein